MSEEEIINILENYNNEDNLQKIHKAIQGLLDLYNKEKEENKKLRNCHLRYEEMTGIDFLLED